METPFRSPSMLTCLTTRKLPEEHLHASLSLSPSKLTSTVHQAPLHPKTSSSCAVHHKACFASDQPQDAPPPFPVRFLTPLDSPFIIITITGHTSPILCASFSHTGNFLATGSGDTNVRLWDLDTEIPSHVLTFHPRFDSNRVIGRRMLLHYPDSVLLIRLIIDGNTSYKCRLTMDPLLKAYFFFGGALATS